jgi:hypothetical protein
LLERNGHWNLFQRVQPLVSDRAIAGETISAITES